jgi:hypothetical protein
MEHLPTTTTLAGQRLQTVLAKSSPCVMHLLQRVRQHRIVSSTLSETVPDLCSRSEVPVKEVAQAE